MPDIWYDVDTALGEVPINKMPLIDDGDFKSREESVAYNAAGLDLVWNFVTTAGAMTQTAVTPTDTGGNYDWVNQGNGNYSIEIPASGGASINNDTEGFGWFSGVATGILPWVGPVCGFRHSALNNSLVDAGTTGLLAPATAGRTLEVDASGRATANTTQIEGADATDALAAGALAGITTYDPPTHAELVSEVNAVQADIAALNNLSSAGAQAAAEAALATYGASTFDPSSDEVDADVKKMNGTTVQGNGTAGDLWRGA